MTNRITCALILLCALTGCNSKNAPHMVKDYGCNMWIMDYGPGHSSDDVFLNTTPEGDGKMYYGADAKAEALITGLRLFKTSTCNYNYHGPE